jgi:hypothetical protein
VYPKRLNKSKIDNKSIRTKEHKLLLNNNHFDISLDQYEYVILPQLSWSITCDIIMIKTDIQ